jgi:heme exporter protein A
MLEVTSLHFDYQDTPLLKNISFTLGDGGLLHIKGANGSGKTTLLKLLAGLYQPQNGTILFQGETVEHHALCYVGHKTGLNPHLTIRENCLFDVHYHGVNVLDLAAVFHLEHYIDQPVGLLSAGQQRQVSLLRLWMSQAPLWLLDEPLVALDDTAINVLMSCISRHRQRGGLVVLTSHQMLKPAPHNYAEYVL